MTEARKSFKSAIFGQDCVFHQRSNKTSEKWGLLTTRCFLDGVFSGRSHIIRKKTKIFV